MNARIARERLGNQGLAGPGRRGPADVVGWLGAVQAQEYAPAKWGLALRMSARATDAEIERAVNAGRMLRTHVLRPTWHFVTPADIRWMLELTAPQVHRRMAPYNRRLGLDPAVLVRAPAVFERALRDGHCLTRTELAGHLERAGLPYKGTHLAHLAMYAELEGVITSGPRRGKQFTYALLEERAPQARRLPRDEGLAELIRRYFRSHGPATARDFAWWSGLTMADARRGLDMSGARRRDVDGRTYWTVARPQQRDAGRPAVHLLPVYDEFLVAYRDRDAVPHGGYAFQTRPSGTVTFPHSLVIDGQVSGTWRARETPDGLMVDLLPRKRLSAVERRAIAREAARYGRFLGRPVSLSMGQG
ncbi:MAG: winged helix DNA-binding domain-containing protein [Gemmatimonadales bacterium]